MVAAPAEVSGLVAEELQKNEQLRATLQSMGGATSPQVARPSPELEGKLKAIALSKEHLTLKQRIERSELQIKQLQEQVESDRVQMKKVQKQMDEYSRAGDPVWEKNRLRHNRLHRPVPHRPQQANANRGLLYVVRTTNGSERRTRSGFGPKC